VRILLTGRDGQIGWELLRCLAPLGEIVAPSRSQLDVEDAARLREAVRGMRPDVIVNAAAYTNVDQAEVEVERAFAANGDAPGVLAEEAARIGALLVHFSTDYVFDGMATQPYDEQAQPSPLGAYGRSKLLGEQRIRESGAQALVLRTAWVYATRGRNFLRTIQRLARERDELGVVDDQRGTPTWARLVAQTTGYMLCVLRDDSRRDQAFAAARTQCYHLTCAGETSWHGFAAAILLQMRDAQPAARLAALKPITSAEYPSRAARPRYSVLSCARLARDYGISLPDWNVTFDLCVAS
jgi:dTDP-4-dehydrorhamnose reductase